MNGNGFKLRKSYDDINIEIRKDNKKGEIKHFQKIDSDQDRANAANLAYIG